MNRDSDLLDLDLVTNSGKILDLDPDGNSMYLDPQHWMQIRIGNTRMRIYSL